MAVFDKWARSVIVVQSAKAFGATIVMTLPGARTTVGREMYVHFSRILDRLAGSRLEFRLEHRVLNLFAACAVLGFTLATVVNLQVGVAISAVTGLCSVFMAGAFYAARWRKWYGPPNAILMVVFMFGAAGCWLLSDGSRGSVPLYLSIGPVVMTLLLSGRARAAAVAGLVALSLGLLALEHARPAFVVPYPSEDARLFDMTFSVVVSLLTVALIVAVFKNAHDAERSRADGLLLNILPAQIADRLKAEPKAIAGRHEEVSVLFCDIVGFTDLAGRLDPPELVSLLNRLFAAFDDLCERHGIEKIKTIGDAYMAAAGIPEPDPEHATAVAEMALDMRSHLEQAGEHASGLRVRIGLNSGSVVAGVIGKKKFTYDLWVTL